MALDGIGAEGRIVVGVVVDSVLVVTVGIVGRTVEEEEGVEHTVADHTGERTAVHAAVVVVVTHVEY